MTTSADFAQALQCLGDDRFYQDPQNEEIERISGFLSNINSAEESEKTGTQGLNSLNRIITIVKDIILFIEKEKPTVNVIISFKYLHNPTSLSSLDREYSYQLKPFLISMIEQIYRSTNEKRNTVSIDKLEHLKVNQSGTRLEKILRCFEANMQKKFAKGYWVCYSKPDEGTVLTLRRMYFNLRKINNDPVLWWRSFLMGIPGIDQVDISFEETKKNRHILVMKHIECLDPASPYDSYGELTASDDSTSSARTS